MDHARTADMLRSVNTKTNNPLQRCAVCETIKDADYDIVMQYVISVYVLNPSYSVISFERFLHFLYSLRVHIAIIYHIL